MLGFLRMQMARNATDEGMISWRLRQAHFELRAEGCRFRENGFSFDHDTGQPIPLTTEDKRETSSSRGASGEAGGRLSITSLNLGAEAKIHGESQRTAQSSIAASSKREFHPISLVQSTPHPKWFLRARPPISETSQYTDFDVFLDGRYISEDGEAIPIAEAVSEVTCVEITPLLTFRPSDVVLCHEGDTGLFQTIGERLEKKTDRLKEAIVDILLTKSVFPIDYKDEIALEGPVLLVELSGTGPGE